MRFATIAVVQSLVAAALLAGCSSENPKITFGKNLPLILNELKLKRQQPAQNGNALAGLTRVQLNGIDGPLLVAELKANNAVAVLSPVARNGDVQTFFTPDQISVSLQSGILVATRGLSGDLLFADAGAAAIAVAKGRAASYSRQYRWLDGENHQVERRFQCNLVFVDTARVEIVEQSHRARHMQETCTTDGQTIVNDFWVGTGKPVIWQSHQWIGPELGYLDLTVLIPG